METGQKVHVYLDPIEQTGYVGTGRLVSRVDLGTFILTAQEFLVFDGDDLELWNVHIVELSDEIEPEFGDDVRYVPFIENYRSNEMHTLCLYVHPEDIVSSS